jgi:hypothetical protein
MSCLKLVLILSFPVLGFTEETKVEKKEVTTLEKIIVTGEKKEANELVHRYHPFSGRMFSFELKWEY